jgi:hypothetical protein
MAVQWYTRKSIPNLTHALLVYSELHPVTKGQSMATQKIKFKMSVKELSFEFEGDIETGQRIQNDIRKSLAALTHSPTAVLPADQDVIESEFAPALENGKPAPDNGKVIKPRRTRRGKANSPRTLIAGLRRSGFFTQKRDLNAIRDELARSGHNFKPNELSAAVIPLCKKGILKRDQGENGNYEYVQGEADVDIGTGEDAE